jgi:toxin co-regulated pilus biosynthesis protein Q
VSTRAVVDIRSGAVALLAVLLAATAGCATKPAPEYGGRWKAVNRYAEEPREIPLYEAYVFYPSPMDGTLKAMLTRWARDSKMTLSYLHSSDFTLHSAVAQIHTNDLKEAVSQLTSAYAAQGVSVTTEGNQIVVRNATTATAAAAPADDKAAATP